MRGGSSMYGNRKFIAAFALSVGLWTGPTHAATYVYVSNAEDGTIGMYTMENDGTLKPGAAIEAGKLVMPMSVSPDKRFLVAAVRSQPRGFLHDRSRNGSSPKRHSPKACPIYPSTNPEDGCSARPMAAIRSRSIRSAGMVRSARNRR